MGCISMKSISSSIISLVHVTVFFLHFGVSSFPAIFAQVNSVVVIIYIHKFMLIRILSSDWSISIQVPSKFNSIQFKALFRVDINHTNNTSSNELLKSTKLKVERKIGCISIPSKSVQVF